jgi:hypothetical protein
MTEKLNQNWIADSKSELAQFFNVSLNTTSNWLLRGCPVLEGSAKGRYKFYLPDVVGWLSLGGPSEADEPAELSIERAKLARAQTEKSKVETELKRTQLGAVLAGGMIPATYIDDIEWRGELIINSVFSTLVAVAPVHYFGGRRSDIADDQRRMHFVLDEYRWEARAQYKKEAAQLRKKYLGNQVVQDDEQDGSDDES